MTITTGRFKAMLLEVSRWLPYGDFEKRECDIDSLRQVIIHWLSNPEFP